MTPHQVVEFFGSVNNAALRIGVSTQQFYQYIQCGSIPPLRQFKIQVITKNRLVVEERLQSPANKRVRKADPTKIALLPHGKLSRDIASGDV